MGITSRCPRSLYVIEVTPLVVRTSSSIRCFHEAHVRSHRTRLKHQSTLSNRGRRRCKDHTLCARRPHARYPAVPGRPTPPLSDALQERHVLVHLDGGPHCGDHTESIHHRVQVATAHADNIRVQAPGVVRCPAQVDASERGEQFVSRYGRQFEPARGGPA